MEKTLFLVRGLPGSGKTTFAKQLSDIVFEADMYFESNGEYKFDPSKIRDAHEWCKGHVRYLEHWGSFSLLLQTLNKLTKI